MAVRHEGRGVYWEIPICASAFLGEEVVVIQKIKCPNHKCGRRIFDIGITRFRIIVELKCPHCGEVVAQCDYGNFALRFKPVDIQFTKPNWDIPFLSGS